MTKKQYDEVVVFTDGGARGNPGPAALGVAIYEPNGTLIDTYGEYLGEQTNNYAEYSALVYALKQAKKLGAKKVTCKMDSELIVKQLAGEYRVRNEGLIPLFADVKKFACDFEEISFSHVRREYNKMADKMVNSILDRMV
ncbi:MAG: ribonuclease HI family protein [bacterium]|nr:ribonuclease HI family protein [bacterium]